MAITRRNLQFYRQDTVPFSVTVENQGSPIDITDYSFRLTAKYSVTDSDSNAVFSITSPGNIIKTDAANGELLITIPSSATSSLEIGFTYRLYYDLQMYADPGTTYTVMSGIITVFSDISQTSP